MKKIRKLATGHSRSYLVTIGNLGYLKFVELDMYPKFLEISFVQVVRHSAEGGCISECLALPNDDRTHFSHSHAPKDQKGARPDPIKDRLWHNFMP